MYFSRTSRDFVEKQSDTYKNLSEVHVIQRAHAQAIHIQEQNYKKSCYLWLLDTRFWFLWFTTRWNYAGALSVNVPYSYLSCTRASVRVSTCFLPSFIKKKLFGRRALCSFCSVLAKERSVQLYCCTLLAAKKRLSRFFANILYTVWLQWLDFQYYVGSSLVCNSVV